MTSKVNAYVSHAEILSSMDYDMKCWDFPIFTFPIVRKQAKST